MIGGASQVAAAWGVILRPLKIQVRSRAILIHAAPKVRFKDGITGKPDTRELGDLLIVIDHLRGGAVADRRAVLVQAKLADATGLLCLGVSGVAQRNLYLRWPKFTMPSGYKSHERDLNDKSCKGLAVDGCRFGGINLHGPLRDWKQIQTARQMSTRRKTSLGTSITRMASGTAGREAVSGGTDPWSELVDELLTVTLSLTHPKQGAVRRSWETLSFLVDPRGRGRDHLAPAFVSLEGLPPRSVPGEAEESEPPLDISTIHIEFEDIIEKG